MRQKINQIVIVSMILLLGALPAYADLVFCGGRGEDPCTFKDMFGMVYQVVNYLISGAGLVAIFFVVLGGVQLLISAGNETKVKEAKDTIRNALLGLLLVLFSYMIVGYLVGLMLPGSADPLERMLNIFNRP